jgi:hypothetical protein
MKFTPPLLMVGCDYVISWLIVELSSDAIGRVMEI